MNKLIMCIYGLSCLAIGVYIGSKITSEHLNEKYEDDLEKEINEYKSRLELQETDERVIKFKEFIDAENNNEIETDKDLLFEEEKNRLLEKYNYLSDKYKSDKQITTITDKEFYEEYTHHDKITLTYYKKDEILCDENEELIPSIKSLLGEDSISKLNETDSDTVVYYRNKRLGSDFEVIIDNGSYYETVFGEE